MFGKISDKEIGDILGRSQGPPCVWRLGPTIIILGLVIVRDIIMDNNGSHLQEMRTDSGFLAENSKPSEVRLYEQCGCQIGCGKYTTKRCPIKFLNFLNNPKCALFFLSLVSFAEGFVVSGIVNVIITTIERRFGLSSSESGVIVSSFDIASCVCLLFVTYLGGRRHKAQWLGWGLCIMGVGSILFSLPHFIAPTYTVENEYDCDESKLCVDKNSLRALKGFFIVGQLLHGVGATPIFTLALAYLDENVKQKYSSIYHGIFYAFAVLGPGIGYIVGGAFLTSFTNPDTKVTITPLSVLWVGNWWAGFLIAGGASFLLAIPLLLYPTQLPGTDSVRVNRENEMHQGLSQCKVKGDSSFGKSFRDLPKCLLILLHNPTMVFISLGAAMDNGIINGIAPFTPKYIETAFSLSAANAAFYFGMATIFSALLAQLAGGFLVSKLDMKVPQMLMMTVITSILALGFFVIFAVRCESSKIAGYVVPFMGQTNVSCDPSTSCGCSTAYFDPVCGSDGLTYASYCDALCTGGYDNETTKFLDCSRINPVHPINGTAVFGRCGDNGCNSKLNTFLVFFAFAVFFTFLGAQPQIQASLRSVPFYQRSFALGIQWLVLRLLGSVPLPIIMGVVLDLSCSIWAKVCDECGSCQSYNEAEISKYMVTTICLVKGLSVVFFFAAWKTYKPPPKEEIGINCEKGNDLPDNRREDKNVTHL